MIHAGRMGKASDPDGVIDSRTRVNGVKGSRVVYASVFVILPPGYPMNTICEFRLSFLRIAEACVLMMWQMRWRKRSRTTCYLPEGIHHVMRI